MFATHGAVGEPVLAVELSVEDSRYAMKLQSYKMPMRRNASQAVPSLED